MGPYINKINSIVQMAEAKVGKDTADYLREMLRTSSFRHTGIVNADKETLEWAAKQETKSTFSAVRVPTLPGMECDGTDYLHQRSHDDDSVH
jgi:hypothetical protein